MVKKVTKTNTKRRNPGVTPAPVGMWKRMVSSLKQGGIRNYVVEVLTHTENVKFIAGLCLLGISVFLIISFVSNIFTGRADYTYVTSESADFVQAANYGGKLGAYLSNYFMDTCFGVFAILIPVFTFLAGVKLMGEESKIRLWKWFLNLSIIMIWGSVFLSLVSEVLPAKIVSYFSFRLGGGHGDYVRNQLTINLGTLGAWIVMMATAIFYLMYLTRETVVVVRQLMHPQKMIKSKLGKNGDDMDNGACELADEEAFASVTYEKNEEDDENAELPYPTDDETNLEEPVAPADNGEANEEENNVVTLNLPPTSLENKESASLGSGITQRGSSSKNDIKLETSTTQLDIEEMIENDKADGLTMEDVLNLPEYDPRAGLEYYKFPSISLLKHYEESAPAIDMAEQNANKDRIITVLRNFGVEISSIKATIGPTITLYEVTPAPGVRINKIRNLEDDIALSLSALGIRIIAPIPGKGTIGIEVPNKTPRIVSMESIINTRKFQDSTFELPIALGKTITNEVFMVDLAKMPHLLVAGATGQGKSVGLNAIITSLLYKKHPAELKFVMVDPKKVEFSIYAPIEKHFLAKIPDENEDPIITDVTKVVQTLKSLCQLMDHRYDLLKKAKVRNIKEYNAKFKSRRLLPKYGHEFMPYIVVIIDEFGDLIMTAGKEVELPIARIAQLARAVGIHMVIATQRPTTNIITGTIKANFPARMAFKVMSQIDSRTILDQSGANQLVGKGDMLFLCGNTPTRVQCAFVDTPEVEKINDFISDQQGYLSAFELPIPETEDEGNGKSSSDLSGEKLDDLFEEAARLIVIHQQGSTSLIQRKFAIGYNRAGRLMDQLEKAGIVGPVRGSKPREVLCTDEVDLASKLALLTGKNEAS